MTKRFTVVGQPLPKIDAWGKVTGDTRYADDHVLPRLAFGTRLRSPLAHPEVRIHEYGDGPNVHKNVALQFGDVEAAFAAADLVREDVFFYEGNTHLPMEQHAAVAHATPDGKLTLWSSTQTPHYVHRLLAKILEMPAAHIRVIAAAVGGGFGGKLDPFSHEIAACRLSQLIGRPVKIACTREEVFYIHRGRHPVLMWIKTGFTKAGDITGCHLKTWLDGGAYGSYGVASTFYTGVINPVTYKMPVYKFEGARIFTNKPPCGPKRGHGTPQPRSALEGQPAKAAERLGLQPAERRHRHRAGLRLDPRVPRGRGARPRSEGRARSSGRHEPHARRPRLLFLARDADVRPGGHPGRRAPALRDPQGRGRQARRGRGGAGNARAKGRRPRRLGEGGGLRAGRGARRGHARRARVRRLVRSPQARGEIQGRWSRSVALLFVHGMCRRAVGR